MPTGGLARLVAGASLGEDMPRLTPAAARALDRVVRLGLALTAIAVTVQTVAGLVHGLVLDRYYVLLDPDGEGNAFTWASAVAAFAGGFAALLLAAVHTEGRRVLVPLAALLSFFSLDDVVTLHERLTAKVFVGQLDLSAGFGGRLGAVVYLPLLAAAGVLLLAIAAAAPVRARRLVVAGLACLALAVGLELLNAALSALDAITSRSALDVVIATAEEGLELGGWMVVATGLAGLAVVRLVELGTAGEPPYR